MRNPFSAKRFAPGVLPWIGEGEIERLLDAACTPGARLQILGPHGSGKSTLLVHLERAARARGVRTVRFRGSRGLVLPRPGTLVLADEAEEMGRPQWTWLRLFATSLVVTAHRDLGFVTLVERRVDVATLRAIVALLAPEHRPGDDDLRALLARHDENVREVLFELYDRFELKARASSPMRSRPA